MRLLWEEAWGVLSHLSFTDDGPVSSPCKQVPLSWSVTVQRRSRARVTSEPANRGVGKPCHHSSFLWEKSVLF